MKLLLALLLGACLLWRGLDGHGHQRLFYRYAKVKILEQCYGAELLTEWHDWMSGRVAECKAGRSVRSADDSAELDSIEDLHETVLSPEQLAALKKKKEKKMRLLNCVMDAMNITMTADGTVETSPIVSYIKKAKMDADLQTDLTARIERCGQMKMEKSCRPSLSSTSTGDSAFPTKMAFMKCEMRARLQACIAQDLKKDKGVFQLGAIEDMFAHHHHLYDDIYDDDDDHDDHDDDDDDV